MNNKVKKNMVSYIMPDSVPFMGDTITGKSILNKSKVEYVDVSCNLTLGCKHSCSYCYARNIALYSGAIKNADEWKEPKIKSNALELIEKAIPNLAPGTIPLLSLMSDPFQYGRSDICNFSLQAIALINSSGHNVSTLTKGLLPVRELAQLSHYNIHGISLSGVSERIRETFEPGASPYRERIMALRQLSELNIPTWVSLEPIFPPSVVKQNIYEVLESVSFVKYLVYGKINNFGAIGSEYRDFYNEEAHKVIEYCQAHGIVCHIKNGTIT